MARKANDDAVLFWTLLQGWLRGYLPNVRRASPDTVEAYAISLECFVGYLEGRLGVDRRSIGFGAVERDAVKGWVAWMGDERGYAPTTVELRLAALKSFLHYCSAEDMSLIATYLQVDSLKGPRPPKGPVNYLKHEETEAILAAYGGKTAKERRNRAMLIFLYESAARVSELVGVRVGDLSLSAAPHVVVTGKGSKTRLVPIGEDCAEHMRVYLEEFHPGVARGSSDPLFYCKRGGKHSPLSTDAVSLVLKNAATIARGAMPTLPQKIHCHLIRKTRAMDLYQAGVPLPIVKQILGHSSMSTTSDFYAFATDAMTTEAVRGAAPEILKCLDVAIPDEKLEYLYKLV